MADISRLICLGISSMVVARDIMHMWLSSGRSVRAKAVHNAYMTRPNYIHIYPSPSHFISFSVSHKLSVSLSLWLCLIPHGGSHRSEREAFYVLAIYVVAKDTTCEVQVV